MGRAILLILLNFGLHSTLSTADEPYDGVSSAVSDTLAIFTSKNLCSTCAVDNWREIKAQKDLLRKKKWKDVGFINPVFDTWNVQDLYGFVPATEAKFTHKVKLSTVIFRDSNWSKEEVKERFKLLARVYLLCGIQVSGVDVTEANFPEDWVDVNGKQEEIDGKIVSMTPIKERPVFYYTRSSKTFKWAYSYIRPTSTKTRAKQESGKKDTVWITSEVKGSEATVYKLGVSVESHELAHVLEKNSEHTKGPAKNILADDYRLFNNDITEAQCKRMKKHSVVRPL